ncbi:hypothetical protein, partial [Acidisphaera rubrifaciens]|uniref:hypothetical protein n=1 Tax=Acidisphaera rubrifaciens TaxID=50715 RepID=UPI0006626343
EEWQAVADAIDQAAAAGEGMSGVNETLGRIGENARNLTTYTGDSVVRQEGLERATRKTLVTTERLSKASKEVASAFLSAAKWLTIGGGIAGLATGAGLFGLDRMAGSVYRDRRAAQGLGLDM